MPISAPPAPRGAQPTSGRDPNQFLTLMRSVEHGVRKLDPLCKAEVLFNRVIAGPYYQRDWDKGGMTGPAPDERQPMNLLADAVAMYVAQLAARNPRVLGSSDYAAYRPYARILAGATQRTLQKMKFVRTMRRVLTSAFTGAGIVRTGRAETGRPVNIDGEELDPGELYADQVPLAAFVVDPWATVWEKRVYAGNRYSVPKAWALDSGIFDPEDVQAIPSTLDVMRKEETSDIGRGPISREDAHELSDTIDLIDLHFPASNMMMTVPAVCGDYAGGVGTGVTNKPLRVWDNDSAERGPYHLLGFKFIDQNIMPVPLAGHWFEFNDAMNTMARKAMRQAERSKRVVAYEPSADEDMARILETGDGQSVQVKDVNKIKEINYGGISDDVFAAMTWMKEYFSEISGNTDQLAGRGADADTARGMEILQGNQNVRSNDMDETFTDFQEGIVQDLSAGLHADPTIRMPMVMRAPNLQPVQVFFDPAARPEGVAFTDFIVEVQAFSSKRQDPQKKVENLFMFATQAVPAALQAEQMSMGRFSANAMLRQMADAAGIEEYDELWLGDVENTVFEQMLMMRDYQPIQGVPMMPGGQGGPGGQPGMAGPGMGQMGQPQQGLPGRSGGSGGVPGQPQRPQGVPANRPGAAGGGAGKPPQRPAPRGGAGGAKAQSKRPAAAKAGR